MAARYHRITVEGPFRTATDPVRDAQQARATLESASGTQRLIVTVPGPHSPRKATLREIDWQDVMGLLTLLELAKWNPADLTVADGVEQLLHLLEEVNPREWEGTDVEAFVQTRLFEYMISRTVAGWQATALPELQAFHQILRTDPENVVPIFTVRCHNCNLPIYVLHDGSRGSQPFPHDAFVITCLNQSCRRRARYGRAEVFST